MCDHASCLQVTEASAGGMRMKMHSLGSRFPVYIKLPWFMLKVWLITYAAGFSNTENTECTDLLAGAWLVFGKFLIGIQ